MIIQPYSFAGTLLQSTDFETAIPRESALAQLEANLAYVKRSRAQPVYAGKQYQPVTLNLEVKLLNSFMSTLETLNKVFDVNDDTPRQFIIQDTEDSNKQYYVYATTKRVLGGHDGQMATVTLGLDDAIWQSVTENSQAWAITASGQSTDVTINGNAESYPRFTISMSGGFGYKRDVEYIPSSAYAWNNRPVELASDTAGIGIDTAALVSANKAQSDGDDFRVFVDGVEVPRWFGGSGFNTTDTKVWINLNQPIARTFKLLTAVASSDSPDYLEFIYSAGYAQALAAMPTQGRVKINSEELTYTSKYITTTKLRVYGITRGVRNTSAGSHSSSDTVSWIPYDIAFFYGSSDAEAPDIDDAYKPIITLSTSSNSSFVYGDYSDNAGNRSGIWTGAVLSVTSPSESQTTLYTGVNDGGDTDPAAIAGLKLPAYQSNGVWRPETSALYWQAYFPDGVSSFTTSYERYQYNASSPSNISILSSADGTTWSFAYRFSALTTTDYATWVTGSLASSDFTLVTNARYIRFGMSGSVTGVANNVVNAGLTTSTVTQTNPPTTSVRSEVSNGKIDATFTVGSNFMRVIYPLPTSKTLTIDTNPDFPYASVDGQYVNGAIYLSSTRPKWLALSPGSNTISYTSSFSATMTVTIYWRDRMNYL